MKKKSIFPVGTPTGAIDVTGRPILVGDKIACFYQLATDHWNASTGQSQGTVRFCMDTHQFRVFYRGRGGRIESVSLEKHHGHRLEPKKLIESVVLLTANSLGDRFLATTRRGTTDQWGLPGGKVDPGETQIQALVREVLEETGISIPPERLQKIYSARCGDHDCHTYYLPGVYTDRMCSVEHGIHVDVVPRWELTDGPFGAYNREVFKAYEKFLT